MPAEYNVRTNRIGRDDEWWKGWVAYRLEDLNAAWRQGKDLNCLVAQEHPRRMVIPHDLIFKRIKKRKKFPPNGKYAAYELAWFVWQPNYTGATPLEVSANETVAEPPQQKKLF